MGCKGSRVRIPPPQTNEINHLGQSRDWPFCFLEARLKKCPTKNAWKSLLFTVTALNTDKFIILGEGDASRKYPE
jgi:hypothetical protein